MSVSLLAAFEFAPMNFNVFSVLSLVLIEQPVLVGFFDLMRSVQDQ